MLPYKNKPTTFFKLNLNDIIIAIIVNLKYL